MPIDVAKCQPGIADPAAAQRFHGNEADLLPAGLAQYATAGHFGIQQAHRQLDAIEKVELEQLQADVHLVSRDTQRENLALSYGLFGSADRAARTKGTLKSFNCVHAVQLIKVDRLGPQTLKALLDPGAKLL